MRADFKGGGGFIAGDTHLVASIFMAATTSATPLLKPLALR